MTLILERLSPCFIDPIAQIQNKLFRVPGDDTPFLVDRSRCTQLFVLNERTGGTRRIYAVSNALVQELGDLVRQCCIIPIRSATGAVSLIQINLLSSDGFSKAKRELMESDHDVYTTTRLKDSYVFTKNTETNILPVTEDEYTNVLELVFADSIVDSKDHPIFKKYCISSTHDLERDLKNEEKEYDEKVTKKPSRQYDDILNIDINLDNINDIL
ncbi:MULTISPECIES: hypothetical protein [Aeromonas]|uniref:Uncharacterized protein n=2 Tax=Aeromonas TaxID=642 RepID=A0A5J6WVL1_9GAMM|nr:MULTISPECIES: hypothetical protein [Aeromonas]QFI55186.1 hypothetical protein FE240_11125 [Aeromonas simiae]TNH79015.1 hypothetical protein CF140_20585 [Aeromonas sobria]BBQ32671.1 hypothetical protein WP2W18E01_42530 [Aeromonas caviae]